MNTFDTIYSRKSVRSYTGEAISDAELNEILKAAWAAPVGRGRYDTLHLTVISNKEYLAKVEANMAAVVGNPNLHPFYGAPTLILVSSAGPVGNVNFSNAAIVTHNMALAATELGVGCCHIWGAVGVLNGNAELVKELNLPEGMVPCCAIALGKTDEKYETREVSANRIATAYLK